MAERTRSTRDTEPSVNLDPLVGELVRLRELRDEDLPKLVAWWNDPAVGAYQRPSNDPRPASAVIEQFQLWCRNDGNHYGFCITKRKGGELLGQAGLFGFSANFSCAIFGIMLGAEHHGRGYGTDAARVMVRYGFAELGLHRIELGVYGFNPRAIAAYRKAGFVEEGRRREAIWRSGEWHDDVRMGLLRQEWLAGQST